ncbi:MAG: DUF72 domain-containing protein [Planctomycetota bacterium]|jgi:uncharacterized protein YecE (DUF72 family)
MSRAEIRIGIAGWSYPDWKGIVYPRSCKDSLRQVAKLVDFIEINSSFYHSPTRETCSRWLERTKDLDTHFTAKLPQASTHDAALDDETVGDYLRGLEPMADSGRLDALLAQFSYRLVAEQSSFDFLERLAQCYSKLAPLALELRHGSWNDPVAQQRVADMGFSLVHLDYPGGSTGFDGSGTQFFGPEGAAYMRLHGRNRDAWFSKEAGRDETYDYEYGQEEVEAIEKRIIDLSREAVVTRVVANNHFHGKAMKLVLELLAWYRGEKVDVPSEMVDRFPALAPIAKKIQGELF